MNPYDQYGGSDSYYDAPSGVASIGYGAPKRRLVAIRNGREIYDDDIDAPFETASVTNARNDARQMAHNNAAADQIWDQRQGMQEQPSPAASAAQALMQRYQRKAQPSFSRMGDEFSINGMPVTSNLTADAQAAGMDADSFVQSKYNAAKMKAAQEARNRMTGDFQIGTQNSRLFNDEQFLGLDPQTQAHLFNQVEGYDMNDALTADRMGGNVTLSGLRNQQAIPDRQQNAFKYFGGIEQATGANAFDILSAEQDPNTGEFLLPGKMIEDDMGNKIPGPPRRLRIPPAIIQQMKQQQAYISGYASPEDMNMADPAYRQAQEDDAIIAAKEEYMARSRLPHDQFMADWQRGQQQQQIPFGVMSAQESRSGRRVAATEAMAAKRAAEQRKIREMQAYQSNSQYTNPLTHGMF